MGDKSVCFMDGYGCATCIRDDEDCTKCSDIMRSEHMKMVNEYDTPDVQEAHAQNLLTICDLLKNLKDHNDELHDCAHLMYKVAMFDCADFIVKYTHDVDQTLDEISSLVGKHYHEELIFVQQDNAKLKQAIGQIYESLNIK